MSYKTILAYVTGEHDDRMVLDMSCLLAFRFRSHIDVLFAIKNREALLSLRHTMSADFEELLSAQLEDRTNGKRSAAISYFENWSHERGIGLRKEGEVAQSQGPLTASWMECGSHDRIGSRGQLADLIVLAKPTPSNRTGLGSALGEPLETLLIKAGRPILVLPQSLRDVRNIDEWTALIAWNGTAEASRALGGSMPLLQCVQRVRIFFAVERQADEDAAVRELRNVGRYLSLHAVNVDLSVPIRARNTGAQILEAAADVGASVIVMGASTHSRLRELIVGGATQHVMRHASVPVLLAH